MTCLFPKQVPRRKGDFLFGSAFDHTVPCGSCKSCRIAKSREVAIRCEHEILMMTQAGRKSCSITLTYAPDHLPEHGFLCHSDVVGFIKRLRRRISDQDNRFYEPGFGSHIPLEERYVLRYYGCGEYGESFKRPHYHLIFFGYVPPDLVFHKYSKKGSRLFQSAFLADVWGLGFVSVGEANFQSCAYAARYVMKKITGDLAKDHYFSHIDGETGEAIFFPREYPMYPHGKGLGRDFYDSYFSDMFPVGTVRGANGKAFPTPKYYNEIFKKESPEEYEKMKRRRQEALSRTRDNRAPERLIAHGAILDTRLNMLKRDFDDGVL